MKFLLKNSLNLAFIGLTALLASCAATVKSGSSSLQPVQGKAEALHKVALTVKGSELCTKSEDWELFRTEWRTAMTSATAHSGLGFAYHESEPKPGVDRAVSVVVYVNDYRYISPGARYGLGVMTGNAYVDADVTFRDLKTGKSLGTKKYSTSSTAWQGIFSAMTEKQIQAICEQIVKDAASK